MAPLPMSVVLFCNQAGPSPGDCRVEEGTSSVQGSAYVMLASVSLAKCSHMTENDRDPQLEGLHLYMADSMGRACVEVGPLRKSTTSNGKFLSVACFPYLPV